MERESDVREAAYRRWLIQLRLEGKDLDAAGRMVPLAAETAVETPVCAAVRHLGEVELVFSQAADTALVASARAVPSHRFFAEPAVVARDLGGATPLTVEHCRTYDFVEPVPVSDPAVVRVGPEEYKALVGGGAVDGIAGIVGGASSIRSNEDAAELWIYVDPDHRRRSLGVRLASAWAVDVLAAGKIAFYSHLEENEPSRRLAARLGVRPLFDLVNFSAAVEEGGGRHV